MNEFILVPPSTALEVYLLHLHNSEERRKDVERDRLMDWMWKTIFTCVALSKEIPQLNLRDFSQFPMLNEAWSSLELPEDMDFGIDFTHSESP